MLSLIALKNYIKHKKIANLQNLLNHFKTSSDTLQPMLSLLITKGYVCERKGVNCGSKCNRCDVNMMKIYYWQDSANCIMER